MEHTNTNLLTTLNAEQTAEAIKAAGCAVTSIEHDGVVRPAQCQPWHRLSSAVGQ